MDAIFLDIETTGLDPQIHRPIDLAFKVLDANTHEVKSAYRSVIQWPKEIWEARDPTSIEINGYAWEEVCEGTPPEEVGRQIQAEFLRLHIERGRAVFICQNPSFDRAFFSRLVPVYTQEKLNWPYHWLDFASMYWAREISRSIEKHLPLPEKMSLSKNSIAQASGLPMESTPHRAMHGVDHLIQCYLTVLYKL
jgi:oligoribonuclease